MHRSGLEVNLLGKGDLAETLDVWNRSARGRALYYPLSAEKIAIVLFGRPHFDPEGFFAARDRRGIAGGIVLSPPADGGECGRLEAIFTRSGKMRNGVAQLLMDRGLQYLREKGIKKVATTDLSNVDSGDLDMLEFLWTNRFVFPGVHDPLIDQTVAWVITYLSRPLDTFAVTDEINSLQGRLEREGFVFTSYCANKGDVSVESLEAFPHAQAFKKAIEKNSPLEDLFLAFSRGRVVGGALVSLPNAPTDWPAYGCDCGLFGPTGVVRRLRGNGIGKVLLFRSVLRLKERNCSSVLIPSASTTYPFYRKAGFQIARVGFRMERATETMAPRFKEIA